MPDWTCAHCNQPASYQGHYSIPSPGGPPICPFGTSEYYGKDKIGFCCPEGHTCQPQPKALRFGEPE